MLASGALSPLEGFMARHDYESVVDKMRLANGLPWALPVCLAVDREPDGDRVALTDADGKPSPCSTSTAPTSTTRSARPSAASAPPTTRTPA